MGNKIFQIKELKYPKEILNILIIKIEILNKHLIIKSIIIIIYLSKCSKYFKIQSTHFWRLIFESKNLGVSSLF